MTFTTKCGRCRKRITFIDAQAGLLLFCPHCNHPVIMRPGLFSQIKRSTIWLSILALLTAGVLLVWLIEPEVMRPVTDSFKMVTKMFTGDPRRPRQSP
jgi:DNA-directed RNA polymerase subunit RPC12/RpoP